MIRQLLKSLPRQTQNNLSKATPRFNFSTYPKVTPKYTQLFINNEFVNSIDGKTFDTIDPAHETVITSVQQAGSKDADAAVSAARAAFEGEWRYMSAHQRGNVMHRLADLMERDKEEICSLECQDSGKPYHFTLLVELTLAIKTMRYYAGMCDKIGGQTLPIEGDFLCYTRREPVGVCGQIIPWNFPLLMLTWKWGPVLASGSVTVMKTSEKTPLSALKMAALAKEAGFPPGVINILSGYGDVGEHLVNHPGVDKIAFTGSTKVGRRILSLASEPNIKRVTLELGGKSPNIICHDADIASAVEASKVGLFLNAGQCCIAGSRVYVHDQIYDKFVSAMKESTEKIVVADPFEKGTSQGPQVDDKQFNSVMNYIQQGKDEGAKCILGGQRHTERGYFIKPTIFTDVKDDMVISREEIFGPVMAISKFSDYDEVIARANDSQYGLGAGIQSQGIETSQKLINAIRAGTVYVNSYDVFDCNTPFGGFKDSGLGRELGPLGMDNYLESKTVIIKQAPGTIP